MTSAFFDTMPRVIGHRGAKGLAPENTLSSFRKAAEVGTKSVEIDVTVTRDNKTIIHHDLSLNRCTSGSGPLLLQDLATLRELDAGSWFGNDWAGEKLPTLSEALTCIHELDMSLNLEIKPVDGWQVPTAQRVGQQLQEELPTGLPLLISSFNEECLTEVHTYVPDIPLGYLTDAIPPDWQARLEKTGSASLHVYDPFVTKDAIRSVQEAGYKFLVYTVNETDRARQLLDWGVDAVITDFPNRLLPLT